MARLSPRLISTSTLSRIVSEPACVGTVLPRCCARMSGFCCRFILCTLLGWLSCAALADNNGADKGEGAPRILVFGDSISAAYGIELDAGWVALLQQRLRAQDLPHAVVNASISGETTAGGRARLPALLAQDRYALVLLELGGNDGLRGLSLAQTEANLRAMIEVAQAAGAKVLLLGMRLPPNYGPTYTNAFAAIYPNTRAGDGCRAGAVSARRRGHRSRADAARPYPSACRGPAPFTGPGVAGIGSVAVAIRARWSRVPTRCRIAAPPAEPGGQIPALTRRPPCPRLRNRPTPR